MVPEQVAKRCEGVAKEVRRNCEGVAKELREQFVQVGTLAVLESWSFRNSLETPSQRLRNSLGFVSQLFRNSFTTPSHLFRSHFGSRPDLLSASWCRERPRAGRRCAFKILLSLRKIAVALTKRADLCQLCLEIRRAMPTHAPRTAST